LAINELSIALGEALAANHLTGISLRPNCPSIHSLLFADDLLICGQALLLEAQSMKLVLMSFCDASGQMPNWSMSGLLFSKWVYNLSKQDIQNVFKVPIIDESFIHLGHPLVLPVKNQSEAYGFILQKFKNKLTTYKANSLSHATRVELTNSVPILSSSKELLPRSMLSLEPSSGHVFPQNPLQNLFVLQLGRTFARQNWKGSWYSKFAGR
jgi:hypothetical protein